MGVMQYRESSSEAISLDSILKEELPNMLPELVGILEVLGRKTSVCQKSF